MVAWELRSVSPGSVWTILSGGAADEGTRIKGAAEAEAQFEAKPLTEEERAAP